MKIITDKKIRKFWIEFLKKYEKELQLDKNLLNHHKKEINDEDISYIKEYLMSSLKELKWKLLDIEDENINLEEYKFIKNMTKIMSYIVDNHPYMSSKFEDMIRLEDNNLIKIKSEVLIGNNLLDDDVIKETLISNRYELIELITKHKLLKNIGIKLTLKHIETAIFINQDSLLHKLSINISEEEIINDTFFKKLKEIKKQLKEKLNIEIADIIQFELLEYKIDFSQKHIWDGLKRLKELDIDLSIDDFGSNFSNLKRIIDIRDKQETHLEYIKTIKIDKKITSAVSYNKFKVYLKEKKYNATSEEFQYFLIHLTNIIEIPFLNLKSVLDEHIDKNINDIINEIEKNYKIDIQKTVHIELNKFEELINYLQKNNLIKRINLVFEFIDNKIVKDIIEEISKEKNIEVLAQGYYFKESIEPIYHQDIKLFINKFINYLQD